MVGGWAVPLLSAHQPIATDSLAGHCQTVQYTTTSVLFAVKRCTQTGSRRTPAMESHPPTQHSKKTVCDARLAKCIFVPKMHFTSIYRLQKGTFGKPFLVQTGSCWPLGGGLPGSFRSFWRDHKRLSKSAFCSR